MTGPGQEIVWTALPNGVDGEGRPVVSVLASPRLRGLPRLADFADFLDWPARVNAMTFAFSLNDEPPVSAERAGPVADSALWTGLFRSTMSVRSFEFRDFSNRNIRSFSVAGIMSYVNALYQEVAQTSPGDLPPIGPLDGGRVPGTLGGLLTDLGRTTGHFRLPHSPEARLRIDQSQEDSSPHSPNQLSRLLGTHLSGHPLPVTHTAAAFARRRRFEAVDAAFAAATVVLPGADPSTFGFATQAAMDFYQAHRFYDRPELISDYAGPPAADKVPPAPARPEVDFHRLLTFLGDYPALLRMLGLVVDLTLPLDQPAFGTGTIHVVPAAGVDQPLSTFSTSLSPRTRYLRARGWFSAEPAPGSDIEDGMLKLEGADDTFDSAGAGRRFHVVQVDPDGAALKLVAMASELFSVHSPDAFMGASFDTPDTSGLPTLKSVGFSLVRSERAVRLADRLIEERDRTKPSGDSPRFADHLVRGYRVDILDDGIWRSLCQREGAYTISGTDGQSIPVTLPGGDPIVDEGYVKSSSATSADDKDSDLYLHETLLRWDGWSLVAKRPGRTIVPHESPDRLQQTEKVEWREPAPTDDLPMKTQFVPVAHSLPRLRFGRSYRVRARTVDLAGNSIGLRATDDSHATAEILYARFDPVPPPAIVPRAPFGEGESVERMVIRSNFDRTAVEYAAQHPGYSAVNDRHVIPPKGSQQLAEAHGRFDAAMGENAGSPEVVAAYVVAIREAGTLATAAGSTLVPGQLPPDAPDPDPTDARPVPGAYLVNPNPRFPLPYLPDPAGRGVAFRGLPGVSRVEIRDFAGAWPDCSPLLLTIEERGTVPEPTTFPPPDRELGWDEAGRRLTVSMDKGEVATVRYSSAPGDAVGHMAIWRRWLEKLGDPVLRDLAVEGGHWMISPFRELVLVHAVQQPLVAPDVRLVSSRQAGATFSNLQGRISLSVRSTGQIDLHARWKEPIDSLSDVKPTELEGGGQVASIAVDSRLPEPLPWVDLPVNPDGTREVPEQGGLPFGFASVDEVIAAGFSPDDREMLLELRRFVPHEFGDTRHRWVSYRTTGTTRFREYFSPEITEDPANISRTGDELLVNIRSSARPETPRVLYVVPSFRWVGGRVQPRWQTFSRTRTGGGLRVWMDRPWYSSGEGEKLAAVLWPDDTLPPEFFDKAVSQFGMDPAWAGAVRAGTLRQSDFANAVDTDQNLTLAEATKAESRGVRDATVSIVAFDPEYDQDRRLWFCDIDLSPKASPAYFPFVRLALARYQRHSITDDEKLSAVFQTDFAQLLPARTLTVTFRDVGTLDVTVYGPAAEGPLRNRVEVALEHHDGTIPGDLGWSLVASGPGRPNPFRLSDGTPDISWIPLHIPTALRSRTDLQRSNERFVVQGRPAVARESLPTMKVEDVAHLLDLKPGNLGDIGDIPVVAIPGYELWSGRLQLPDPRANLRPLRLVVREFEHYTADADVAKPDDKEGPLVTRPYLDRVVYADIVDLPGN